MKEHDFVVALREIGPLVPEGTLGVIMVVLQKGTHYIVEFVDSDLNAIGDGMATVTSEDIALKQL